MGPLLVKRSWLACPVTINQGGHPLEIPRLKGLHPSGHPKTVWGVVFKQGPFSPKRKLVHHGNGGEPYRVKYNRLLYGEREYKRGTAPLIFLPLPHWGRGLRGWGLHDQTDSEALTALPPHHGVRLKGDTPLESPFKRDFTPLEHPKTVWRVVFRQVIVFT